MGDNVVRIASFNVNSLRARRESLWRWLSLDRADLVLLQEVKCTEDSFPFEDLSKEGWHAWVSLQKTYNGVAILSRSDDVKVRRCGLPWSEEAGVNGDTDAQARWLECEWKNMIVCCAYVPNGNPVESEKFGYKLRWNERLYRHVGENLLSEDRRLVIGGDFNVCPRREDVYDERMLSGDALIHTKTRRAWRRLEGLGMIDGWRAWHGDEVAWTYWDYQSGRWMKDQGLRIDFFLLDGYAADSMRGIRVDKEPRAGEKPSDHTPLIIELAT